MKLELEVEQEKKSTYLFTKLYIFYFKRILTFLIEKRSDWAMDSLSLLQAEVDKLKGSLGDLESILQRSDRS